MSNRSESGDERQRLQQAEAEKVIPASIEVERSGWILWLVAGYSALAIASWTIIAIQAYRPVTIKSYTELERAPYGSEEEELAWYARRYANNDNWYSAARAMQSIVSALTLPLISASGVVYTQRLVDQEVKDSNNEADSVTLRHLMTVADKGWADLFLYWQLITKRWQWNRSGSRFLACGMALTILGLVIQPLQQISVSTTTVKRPTVTEYMPVMDIMERFAWVDDGREPERSWDGNAVVVATRKLLEATGRDEVQPMLWSGTRNCSAGSQSLGSSLLSTAPEACQLGNFGLSLGNFSLIADPFLAQPPSDFNTGLLSQKVPRINSTAVVRNISVEEFPADCQKNGSYHIEYRNTSSTDTRQRSWSLEVCMPVTAHQNYSYSPWTPTRDRQDFTEQLYIRYATEDLDDQYSFIDERIYNVSSGYAVHITLDTTAGYFELPNYGNNQVPSPILDMSACSTPNTVCKDDGQYLDGPMNDIWTFGKSPFGSPAVPSTSSLEKLENKGPLLTVAMALFGPGSLVDSLTKAPDQYFTDEPSSYVNTCVDRVPISGLIEKDWDYYDAASDLGRCIYQESIDRSEAIDILAVWLSIFKAPPVNLSNLFTTAAFFANRAWITDTQTRSSSASYMEIKYDRGADAIKPGIPLAGVIVISVLLGVLIAALFVIAGYACRYPRWTDTLDAFAMMRIGSSVADAVPLKLVKDVGDVKVLDELPGRVGGYVKVNGGEDDMNGIKLGGPLGVRERIRYESLDGEAHDLTDFFS